LFFDGFIPRRVSRRRSCIPTIIVYLANVRKVLFESAETAIFLDLIGHYQVAIQIIVMQKQIPYIIKA